MNSAQYQPLPVSKIHKPINIDLPIMRIAPRNKDRPPKRRAGGDNLVTGIQRQVLMILGILESRPGVIVLVSDATHFPLFVVGKEVDSFEQRGTEV